MPASAPVRIVVEFHSVGAPVQGRVSRDGRDSVAFIGWLALTRAIEMLSQPGPVEATAS